MRKASGLTLKPAKCVLIPTVCKVSSNNENAIRQWFQKFVPLWQNLLIKDKAKYLGLFLGPGVSPGTNWEAPVSKFVDRTSQLADQGLPLDQAAAQFSSRAVPVLNYVGQIEPLPSKFKSVELRMATKLLGLATNSFCTNTVYNLHVFGGPKLACPSATMHAARIRGALETFSGFRVMHEKLKAAFLEGLLLSKAVTGGAIPPGWQQDASSTCILHAQCARGGDC